jgi:hypothetical protein
VIFLNQMSSIVASDANEFFAVRFLITGSRHLLRESKKAVLFYVSC